MKTTIRIFVTVISFLCLAGAGPKAEAVVPPPDGGYPGGNTAEGQNALFSLTTGGFNTALGFLSLRSDTIGSYNTALGAGALAVNNGDENTATGLGALLSNTTGGNNTANGAFAMFSNTIGVGNMATGSFALFSNTTGHLNTAAGAGALQNNTTGSGNTANGFEALLNNTTASDNTATGTGALQFNITGFDNTANGSEALFNNTSGGHNTAIGFATLHNNDVSDDNTAIGDRALVANTGRRNTALGSSAGLSLTTGDNNIDIGYNVQGLAGEANTIRIGNTDITTAIIRGISGQTIANGTTVFVAPNGQLGTVTSSKRFKEQIKPMNEASQALFSLKPVTFRYKKEIDPASMSQFGLLAEDVEKVNPDLVARDENGKTYSVRYEQVNAMLLNEFLKEHRKVAKLEAALEAVNARLKQQDAKIQRVSDQVDVRAEAARVAVSNR
jgi:hypothetical protein